jgi:UDP-N-acetyl-D-mannosaminuronic acid dehydrogenase
MRSSKNASMLMDICVMGLGNIGLPVAQHISKIHKQTLGYDISQDAVNFAKKSGVNASTELVYADIYVIAVNTWYRNGKPDMSAIEDCTKRVSELNPHALICFESTLVKGTVRELARKYSLVNLAVCPHRWWKQEEDRYGVVQLRVLGALNEESKKKALSFYDSLGIPLHVVSSLEVAELSKLVENTYYYLRIAYAEELKLLCTENNLDFNELHGAVNTKWNVDMAEARDGIGGECLPKDIQFLINAYPKAPLLQGAVTADIDYHTHLTNIKEPLTSKTESVKRAE